MDLFNLVPMHKQNVTGWLHLIHASLLVMQADSLSRARKVQQIFRKSRGGQFSLQIKYLPKIN